MYQNENKVLLQIQVKYLEFRIVGTFKIGLGKLRI